MAFDMPLIVVTNCAAINYHVMTCLLYFLFLNNDNKARSLLIKMVFLCIQALSLLIGLVFNSKVIIFTV